MKKITLFCFCLLSSMMTSYAQFTENFDAGTTTPVGWTVINGGDTNTWIFGTPGVGTANSGTNVARINYSATAHDDYLITPQFTVTLGVSEQLSLWAKHRSDFFAEPFDILLSTTGTAAANFTTTIATAVTPNTTWQKFTYSLAAFAGQTVYIAFRSTTTDEFELYLDDVVVGAIPNPPDYVSLWSPATASFVQGGNVTVYGQIYEGGLTDVAPNIVGQAPGIQAWVGTSATNTNPNTWTNWTLATWNAGHVSNNDEYQATIGANLTPGTYYYATRFVLNGGNFFYGGINASAPNNGSFWDGATFGSGVLTVTAPPAPANDECSGAISLTVNPDLLCGSVTSGTILGATASTIDAAACGGTEDDDVWFSFVATSTGHRISILNAAGSTTDMYHSLWSGADCNSLTLVAGSCSDADVSTRTGLTIGQTYYVRVYTWTATTGQTTTFNVCIGTPPGPPANDECSGAIALTINSDLLCGTVTPGTILSATASTVDATACGGTEDDDVWFSFVATAATHRIALNNVLGSTTDLYHSLWTGADCNSLTLVPGTCSDPNTSNPTGLVIGQTYYLRVYSWTATTGQSSTFDVCIGTLPPPPTNDNFATPIAVSCGNIYTGDTSSQVTLDEDNAPDGFGAALTAPNLWYSFTGLGSAQTVTLNLCGSSYDTSVLVYTGTSGNLTLVAGNDDDSSCVSNGANSKVIFSSDGTTTYYISVAGYNTNVGAFTMNVTCAAIIPPAVPNQDCGTSLLVLVDGLDNNSDNSFGTVSSTPPSCDPFGSVQDVWFSFVAPASGLVTALLTPGTMTSLNFNIYSGACGALTPIANTCNSNLTAGTSESLTALTPGTTYYIQVWSNAAEQGTFALRLSDDGLSDTDFDNASFSYYPNPVKNTLNLSYSQEISNVEIFNLLGQKVNSNSINANQAQVDMSNLSNGVYLVKVISNNQSKTIRVIKE